jgi:alpha-methylacyl-CoA racemase
MLLAFGVACALVERGASGRGQVVDAAMVDGSAILMTMIHAMRQAGQWREQRGANMLDTGAHFYDTFETADGKYVAIGAIEGQFYAELLEKIGLAGEDLPRQLDRAHWPAMKERFEKIFKTRTRAQWCEILEGTDACFAPVLEMSEAPAHPHIQSRNTFVEFAGKVHPAPAPRFDRTPPELRLPPPHAGQHTDAALADWGFAPNEIAVLRESGAIR